MITLQSETVVGGMSLGTQKVTQTLKRLTADKAVVEVVTEVTMGGQTIKSPPQSIEHPARLPPGTAKDAPKSDSKEEGPKVRITKGRETLTVSGKQVACEWTQSEAGGTVTKTWESNDVPGRLVKSVVTDQATKATATTQLVAWKGTRR